MRGFRAPRTAPLLSATQVARRLLGLAMGWRAGGVCGRVWREFGRWGLDLRPDVDFRLCAWLRTPPVIPAKAGIQPLAKSRCCLDRHSPLVGFAHRQPQPPPGSCRGGRRTDCVAPLTARGRALNSLHDVSLRHPRPSQCLMRALRAPPTRFVAQPHASRPAAVGACDGLAGDSGLRESFGRVRVKGLNLRPDPEFRASRPAGVGAGDGPAGGWGLWEWSAQVRVVGV